MEEDNEKYEVREIVRKRKMHKNWYGSSIFFSRFVLNNQQVTPLGVQVYMF